MQEHTQNVRPQGAAGSLRSRLLTLLVLGLEWICSRTMTERPVAVSEPPLDKLDTTCPTIHLPLETSKTRRQLSVVFSGGRRIVRVLNVGANRT